MTTTIRKSQVDLSQGTTEQDRTFGYVRGEDGGMFFTWMDTLEKTIRSIEADEVDGDGGLDEAEVAEFLRDYLPTTPRGQKMWGAE